MISFYKKCLFGFKYFFKYKVLPESLWNFFASFVGSVKLSQYRQIHKSYGSLHPHLTFYVIRRRPPAFGFFSNFHYVLQGILYAEEHDFIPVVDMQNYWVSEYSYARKLNGTYNAWCYFFEQISKYTLDEVYKSKNVILSNGHSILNREHWYSDRKLLFSSEPQYLKIIYEIMNKYIKLNTITLDNYENMKQKLNWAPNNTIGIFIRGTGYIENIGVNAVPPNLGDVIKNVRKILEKIPVDNLYISTEDYTLYVALCNEFKDKYIIPSIRYKEGLKIEEWKKSQNSKKYDGYIFQGYELTLKYLIEILLLSECTFFVTTLSNASLFALAERSGNCKQSILITHGEAIDL